MKWIIDEVEQFLLHLFVLRKKEMWKLRVKIDYDYVFGYFQESGYKLLDETYADRNKALLTVCPREHEYPVSFNNFRYKEARCSLCKKEYRLEIRQKEVELMYEQRGYKLISKFQSSGYITAVCPKDHEWKHFYANFYRGAQCFECNGAKKKTLNEVKSIFIGRGFTPLFDSYADNKERLAFHCPKHPELTPQYAQTSNMENGHANCRGCYHLLFTGENSALWRGGTTTLNAHLRGILYEPWTFESLRKYEFKCVLSGLKEGLHVHHLNKNFSDITAEAVQNTGIEVKSEISKYKEDELDTLKKEVLRLHELYGLGIPLTKKIHDTFHSLYGRKNNNAQQFEEFQVRYENGELETLF